METQIEERLERIEALLKKQSLNEMTNWKMEHLVASTGRQVFYLKERLLMNPKFMPVLESNDVVIYPEGAGGTININTKKMLHFIEENHSKIFGREVYK